MGGPENYMPSERSRMLQADACDSMIGGPRLDGQKAGGTVVLLGLGHPVGSCFMGWFGGRKFCR